MNKYDDFMKSVNDTVILDGAMGTMLMRKGLNQGIPPESWVLENPDIVREIHLSYYQADAQVVHTNTFGANRLRLSEFGLDAKTGDINRKAVELALEVCPQGCMVAGDMGPTGKFLEPVGKCCIDDWMDTYSEQVEHLVSAGVDLISIETMYDVREASIAVQAAKKTGIPTWVSMTFRKTPRGYFTILGNNVTDCFQLLEQSGADYIGINCTLDSFQMVDLVTYLNELDINCFHVQPNAGTPEIVHEQLVYPETPLEFVSNLNKIKVLGVKAVGGCCGTTPEFISELSNTLKIKE